MELADRVALVTGGGGGIGAGIGEALVERGARVVLTDLNADWAAAEAERIGGGTIALAHDVTSLDSWARVKRAAEDAFGPVEVLCNNAGISTRRTLLDETPPEVFASVLAVNVTGVYNGIRTCVPEMRARGEGHVVNVASAGGLMTAPCHSPYSASKHALVGLSKALRAEYAMKGGTVGVTLVCPGGVSTDISSQVERSGPGGEPRGAFEMAPEVAAIFDRDLEARGEKLRFDLERFEDPALAESLSLVYPEPRPIGAQPSVYDYA